MRIAIPQEVKAQEYRVGLTAPAVAQLCEAGHQLLVQRSAGIESGFSDQDYLAAGAQLVDDAESLYASAELVVKVKEPQPEEYALLRPGLALFCYLHLAPAPALTDALLASGVTAIAYETITDDRGHLPLLKPMSEIAGRLSVQAGAHCLEKAQGGSGVLLGSVSGMEPGQVLIFGGGVVGSHASDVALGMGAKVTMVEQQGPRRQQLRQRFPSSRFAVVEALNLDAALPDIDMAVGAALIPGATAPKLLRADQLGRMKPGSVLVDVSVDQGGCFETSRPTCHAHPTFIEQGIVHYGVANIPSAVARTASLALSQATLPYIHQLAAGVEQALSADHNLAAGLSLHRGKLYCPAVAKAQQRELSSLDSSLGGGFAL